MLCTVVTDPARGQPGWAVFRGSVVSVFLPRFLSRCPPETLPNAFGGNTDPLLFLAIWQSTFLLRRKNVLALPPPRPVFRW